MSAITSLLNRPWERGQLNRAMIVVTVVTAIIFTSLYWIGRSPLSLLGYSFTDEASKQFQFLTNIYGENENSLPSRPMAVTADSGTIYVVDSGKQRILTFDYTGAFKGNFGIKGQDKGQFTFPYGIAADGSGQLYVADIGTGKISIFDTDGKFKSYFGNSKDIVRPAGVAVFGEQVLVSDIGLHKVTVFDKKGNVIRTIGKLGQSPGEFNSPNFLTVRDGVVYVSDSGNDRVQVFNIMGTFLREIKLDANGQQFMVNPRGITTDSYGNIYVASNVTHKILTFDKEGSLLYSVGSMGNEDGQLYLPNGIVLDNDGRLLVTDSANQRIVVLSK